MIPSHVEVDDRVDGVTVINDTSSTTPESMSAALRALAALAGDDRPSIAVLGELPELGDAATELHAQIGCLVATLGIGQLITVGGSAAVAMADAARACGSIALIHVGITRDTDHARTLLKYSLHGRDVVLFAGSHVVGLELPATRPVRADPSTYTIKRLRFHD